MSEEDAAILKEYCSFFGISQSDALSLFVTSSLHNHSVHCKKVESLFALRQKKLDKRSGKPCYGFCCLGCAHLAKCTVGRYKGLFEIRDEWRHLSKEDGYMTQIVESLDKSELEA